jgi:hypothetical protein
MTTLQTTTIRPIQMTRSAASTPCPRLSSERYCVHISRAQCERLRRRLRGYGASTDAAWRKCEACEIHK